MAVRQLVVGAGPAGLTMAGELARRGVAVGIIEGSISQPRIAHPDSSLNTDDGPGGRHGLRSGDRACEGDISGAGVIGVCESAWRTPANRRGQRRQQKTLSSATRVWCWSG
ncbi:MAG: FAD-dependent monooxygenase [Pseudonocardiales bacterium]|nr:FAD-dependent monooxygenase [Pseudonocardiales bacterium]